VSLLSHSHPVCVQPAGDRLLGAVLADSDYL
jgi:hypothetical protein